MASKTTLQAVDDPSLAFDPIKVGGDVVLAQHAEVIRALGKRVVHDVIEIGRRLTDAKARCVATGCLGWSASLDGAIAPRFGICRRINSPPTNPSR
jgi:hypothetical protein